MAKTKLGSFVGTRGQQVDVEIEPHPFKGNAVLVGIALIGIGVVTTVAGAWSNGANDMVDCVDDAYKKAQ